MPKFTDEQLASAERVAVEVAQLSKEIEEHSYYLRQDPVRLEAAEANVKKKPETPDFGWMPLDQDQRAEFLRQMQEHREKTPTTFEERYDIVSACLALLNALIVESYGLGFALNLVVAKRMAELSAENRLIAAARQRGTTIEEDMRLSCSLLKYVLLIQFAERKRLAERQARDAEVAERQAQRRKAMRARRQLKPLARPTVPSPTKVDNEPQRPSLTRASVRNMERIKVVHQRGRKWETDEGCSKLHKKIFEYTDLDTGDETLCQVVGYRVSDRSDEAHLEVLFEGLGDNMLLSMTC
ncbi:hypothetical protein FISHEDRAFT_70365 [Fistulina hepatica ATCC 64428]|uniref:Uncharacterized protein n=1 Tax=Fistulina hepatica ATCC 64428 TaxID=1128425 RepID=A0A0D7AJD2_9AGAR|nr:hypothetical protein FISHEDRAFT_70365 [Fistulina hepatica ATCC 64428]